MVLIHKMQCSITATRETVIKRRLDGQDASGSTHRHLCAKFKGLDATWEVGRDVRDKAGYLDDCREDSPKIRGILS